MLQCGNSPEDCPVLFEGVTVSAGRSESITQPTPYLRFVGRSEVMLALHY